jgi:hypothetical protein
MKPNSSTNNDINLDEISSSLLSSRISVDFK